MENELTKERVRVLLKGGVYEYEKLFKILYPTYNGHYSTLRRIISEEKHRGVD